MAQVKVTITVVQRLDMDATQPRGDDTSTVWKYVVKSTVNAPRIAIGTSLTAEELEDMINAGVTVKTVDG